MLGCKDSGREHSIASSLILKRYIFPSAGWEGLQTFLSWRRLNYGGGTSNSMCRVVSYLISLAERNLEV